MPAVTNVADIIAHHARATPQALALSEGERRWGYLDFDRAIWRAAAGLRARGIRQGDRVGVTLPSDALHLVVGYALARMGAIQMSLSEREALAVRDGLAARQRLSRIVGRADVDAAWLEPHGGAIDESLRVDGADAPWKFLTTSGTTGAPKMVLQSHAMHIAWRELNQRAVPVRPDERYLAVVPLDFIAGFRLCTDVHWAGAAVLVDTAPGTAAEFLSFVERAGVNYLYLTPLHLHQLLAVAPPDRLSLPRLRRLRTGSMMVTAALRGEVMRRLTPHLVVAYGTNEVGSPLALASGEILARYPDSDGIAPQGVELRITDEAGKALPAGEIGLVAARTPGMPGGYENNPEASARAFRNGWYYPGDLGLLSQEGVLYLKGRSDDMMNFDGIKIYPSEIETVLLAHPAVAEAAALPVRSAQHQDVPTAVVVLRGQATLEELRRYCRAQLGVRAPQAIVIVASLPKNAAGKITKRELAAVARDALRGGS